VDTLKRVVFWRNLLASGSEYCALWRTREGWVLRGTALAAFNDHLPLVVTYEVLCDEQWRTRRVVVKGTSGANTRTLNLSVDGRARWLSARKQLHALSKCVDVDLGITPATNTLPIQRLNLKTGQSASVTAAWVKFPEIVVQPLIQKYTRLGPDRYRYESATGFSTEILVDDLGLVTVYRSGWERVASL
jgi:hypothetical protein